MSAPSTQALRPAQTPLAKHKLAELLTGFGLSGALASGCAFAQSAPDATPARQQANEVVITASPLSSAADGSLAQPASVVRGDMLRRVRDASLGGSLQQEPGITVQGFGTAVGRPSIRGQQANRVEITENGLSQGDVSALSPDHTVSVDPLSIRQIEVLRGPATLLYGGHAIGGLVNAVTDRLPRHAMAGINGQLDLSSSPNAHDHQQALGLRAGVGNLGISAGGFSRHARDYPMPDNATVIRSDGTEQRGGTLPNSFHRGDGGHLGLAYFAQAWTVGAASSRNDQHYGIPGGEGVSIRMRQQRDEARGEWFDPAPWLKRVTIKAAQTRYQHEELEPTGEVGTRFDNHSTDWRLEAAHQPLLGIQGVIGLSANQRRLQAAGAEAYLPASRNAQQALFWIGETRVGSGRLELGLRHERVTLRGDSEAFGEVRRADRLNSASIGWVQPLDAHHALTSTLSTGQRAAALEERLAYGPHAATRTWEIGNPNLRPETVQHLDIGLRRNQGPLQWRGTVYLSHFRNYIVGLASDADGDGHPDHVDEHGAPSANGEFTLLRYQQGRATFAGFELDVRWHPLNSPWSVRMFADQSRGWLQGLGNLPRQAPMRVGLQAEYRQGPWSAWASALHARRQDRIALLETPTASYTRIDAEIAYQLKGWSVGSQRGTLTLYAQGRNLTDATIRNAASFLKDVAPQPGRIVSFGLRASF